MQGRQKKCSHILYLFAVCDLQKYFKDNNCVLAPLAFCPSLVNIFMKTVFNERVPRKDLHIFDE